MNDNDKTAKKGEMKKSKIGNYIQSRQDHKLSSDKNLYNMHHECIYSFNNVK